MLVGTSAAPKFFPRAHSFYIGILLNTLSFLRKAKDRIVQASFEFHYFIKFELIISPQIEKYRTFYAFFKRIRITLEIIVFLILVSL